MNACLGHEQENDAGTNMDFSPFGPTMHLNFTRTGLLVSHGANLFVCQPVL